MAPGSVTSVSGMIEKIQAQGKFWLALTPVGQPALAVAVTQSEPDGRFRFEGIPIGVYYLFAAGPATARSAEGAILGAEPFFGRTSVVVNGQPIDGISLAVEGGRSVAFVLKFVHAATADACPRSAHLRLSSLEDWGVVLERSAELGGREATIEKYGAWPVSDRRWRLG